VSNCSKIGTDSKDERRDAYDSYYQTLLVTREGGITTIVFNRPEKCNAMSRSSTARCINS
jgi:hypothetical protein